MIALPFASGIFTIEKGNMILTRKAGLQPAASLYLDLQQFSQSSSPFVAITFLYHQKLFFR